MNEILRRYAPLPLLILLILNTGTGCSGYLLRAGYGEISILWNRRSFETILEDPGVSEEVKSKIRRIQDVRSFAEKRLGLRLSGSFTTYSEIHRPYAAWNVSASPPLDLTPVTWWFPIVGRVPYLGYFSENEAEQKKRELESKGLDVIVSPVMAFSTLGWFDDPVLSSQIHSSDWYLTGLVIHESTHSTLWFPGDVDFNESFASFVEEKGALEYYKEKFGKEGSDYQRILKYLDEENRIRRLFFRTTARLHSLYTTPGIPEREKLDGKVKIITEMKEDLLRSASDFQIINVTRLAGERYNNADFLSYVRYDSGRDYFDSVFNEVGGDWQLFFRKMRELKSLSATQRANLMLHKGAKPAVFR